MNNAHTSVLLKESIEGLDIKSDGIYVDGTFGAGGHSFQILNTLKEGHLFAFDQDEMVLKFIDERFINHPNFTFIQHNFSTMQHELNQRGIQEIDGILLDLGMSSMHIDQPERGFSYMHEGPLDMRMNLNQKITAEVILNTYDYHALLKIFRDYGDIEKPHVFANVIINNRPYHTTKDVVKVTDFFFKGKKGHSAKAVFQALRIEVNQELQVLEDVLKQSLNLLKPGGRLVVITFHSLEDRIVKHFMKTHSTVKQLKGLPIALDEKPLFELMTRKPILPSEKEVLENSRSASAKLRISKKTDNS
ncbi:MAG: 16S rRNA (cytosine(1402)-N(4))-methyltransferase RsmH [Firmicutes bacterium]|nr:16S rRNA (cytosine(1402)-N(4))-methyltransferase RsmH [Bacillota bacterium]